MAVGIYGTLGVIVRDMPGEGLGEDIVYRDRSKDECRGLRYD